MLLMFFCFRPDCYPQDKEYDSWNSIADYVFQVIPTFVSSLATQLSQWKNSNATSVLMHHQDLAGIRAVGDVNSVNLQLSHFGRWETQAIFHLCWRDTSHVSLWTMREVNFY